MKDILLSLAIGFGTSFFMGPTFLLLTTLAGVLGPGFATLILLSLLFSGIAWLALLDGKKR